ncbi:MAG: dienelactone hydrolase family protein [Planctomycetaceae bacterium]
MRREVRKIGDLTCRIVSPKNEQAVSGIVILCHGFGAPGDDLVGLADALIRLKPELGERIQFVFPEAPLTIPEVPGGRAWWPIDMMEMQLAIMKGTFREMRQAVPEQMPQAREKLQKVIDQLREETGVPVSRLVLGGFSQGSMLATDLTLRLPEGPAALLIYSGTLLAEPEWRKLSPSRAALPVLQSHGTVDPILPFEAANWLKDLLTDSGLDVEFIPFQGVHTIPFEALESSARLIDQVIDSQE